MPMRNLIIAIIIIVSQLLSACGSSNTGSITLDGSEWFLVNMNNQLLQAGNVITIKFTEGQVSGSAGCNSYGGDYTISQDDVINIGMIMSTAMACLNSDGIMEQERIYLMKLAETSYFQVVGDELFMEDVNQDILLVFGLISK